MKYFYFLFFILSGFWMNAQNFSRSDLEDSCTINTADLEVDGANDIKAIIQTNGSFASAYQPGENIDKSFDNNLNTWYHSPWGYTEFPVTLNYRLDGNSAVDYLKYISRTSGNNGDFGNVSIHYNTNTDSDFIHLMDYDFNQSGQTAIVNFPFEIMPLNIQITIFDGYGGFASCAEMEFYKRGESPDSEIPEGIFTDELCTELLPEITQSDIDGISSNFYKSLAQCIYDGSYNLNYRTGDYEVFRPVQKISQELKVGSYDPYENATGLAFTQGEKVAVFAQNIPDEASVYLQIKDFLSDGFWGPETHYPLKNGLSVFNVSTTGLGYINYFNENLDLPDVSVHIVSGTVNGRFDLNSSVTDWFPILTNNAYPKVDVIGDFVHMVYDKQALKDYNPFNPHELIQKYDTIIRYQRMMMGLFKYDKSPKNHMLAYTEEGGGYYAGGPGIHLDLNWGPNNVVNPDQLDLWGIPHEFGHINQIRPNLNWIGTTEVTNNVYAVWTNYKMNYQGNSYTRLEAENESPRAGIPAEVGGTINALINYTYVDGFPLQRAENYDVFKVLVPFWQLQLYYQKAGASRNAPELTFDYPASYDGTDYAHWYGTVAEASRNTDASGMTNGDLILEFVKNTCDAVEEDLTDFFLNTGFLKPIQVTLDDYGLGDILITQSMIDQTVTEIQGKGYEQPVSPVIHYMSAHSAEIYKNKIQLSGETGVGVSLNGNRLIIQNNEWEGAVAFETYDVNGNLKNISIVGTGDLSLTTTKIYYTVNSLGVYAVGYDGEKKLVYPEGLSVEKMTLEDTVVYPNPFDEILNISSEIPIQQITLTDLKGNKVWQGKIKDDKTRLELQNLSSGIYFMELISEKGKVVKKVVKR